jgi:hypothetical protein
MYIRCPKCMGSSRFGPTMLDGQPSCATCGHGFSFEGLAQLGSTPLQRYERAEEFARSNGIDLASAYAVLLGILPIDRALSIGDADGPREQTANQETRARRMPKASLIQFRRRGGDRSTDGLGSDPTRRPRSLRIEGLPKERPADGPFVPRNRQPNVTRRGTRHSARATIRSTSWLQPPRELPGAACVGAWGRGARRRGALATSGVRPIPRETGRGPERQAETICGQGGRSIPPFLGTGGLGYRGDRAVLGLYRAPRSTGASRCRSFLREGCFARRYSGSGNVLRHPYSNGLGSRVRSPAW